MNSLVVTEPLISSLDIERGEHNLTVMNIVKIAAALQIKPTELLDSAGL